MKTSNLSISLIFLTFLFFLSTNLIYGQWTPQTTSTTAPIYRQGSAGVGMTVPPFAKLHVKQTDMPSLPGQEIGLIPAFRLEKNVTTSTFSNGNYAWDFFPNEGLQIEYGDGLTSQLAMNIRSYGLEVAGTKLHLGYGGTNSADNMRLGYSNSLNGHYITFNGTYGEGVWQGPSGKVVMHSNANGSLYFLTQEPGGYIGPGQNRRLTITPTGTAIIGDEEKDQVLNVSSSKNSILRLQSKGSGDDFEVLRNGEGDLEFRGGQDGEGSSLNTLMKLRKNGKLLLGTELSPDDLDNGETDISEFRLYVDKGILTKEVRVKAEWSDYVFEPGYELLPLEQVKAHIDEKGYLHNTPSGESIESKGLDLGAMMANQQEKIEELYLHLIQLNEQVQELQKENSSLKKMLSED